MLRYLVAFACIATLIRVLAADAASAVLGPDGVLRYPFGDRNQPTLRCAPLFVCDLVLEPGETIMNVAVGDSVRWLVAPATSGPPSSETSHILVKPTDVGLRTNLVITTNRRTYGVTLLSRKDNPMLRIGFTYPQDAQQMFAAGSHAQRSGGARSPQPLPNVAIDRLDFAYHTSGDRTIAPQRVFNDGTHTFLQMPPITGDLPVVFVAGDAGDELVNYRFTGRYFVLDGIPDRIALVDGTGKRQRRTIVTRGN